MDSEAGDKDGDKEGTQEKDENEEEDEFQDANDGTTTSGVPQVLIEGMDTIEKDMENKMQLAQDELEMDSKDLAMEELDNDDEEEMVEGMNSQRLFIEPQNFREQLWNETGPSAQNMAKVCGVLIREYSLAEGSAERYDTQINNDYISTSLRMWVNHEAGQDMADQVRFLEQARVDVQQIGQEEDSLATPTGSENKGRHQGQWEEEDGSKDEEEVVVLENTQDKLEDVQDEVEDEAANLDQEEDEAQADNIGTTDAAQDADATPTAEATGEGQGNVVASTVPKDPG